LTTTRRKPLQKAYIIVTEIVFLAAIIEGIKYLIFLIRDEDGALTVVRDGKP
jgi:hypothetical protein